MLLISKKDFQIWGKECRNVFW